MNKRRFVDPETRLDLDLTYVCDRLLVMAIPCVGGVVYRNDIRDVARFFATRHYGARAQQPAAYLRLDLLKPSMSR